MGGVNDIGEALSRRDVERAFLQPAERDRAAVVERDRMLVRAPRPHRGLRRVEPRADLQPQFLQSFDEDIDPQRLLQRKAEAGDRMVERARLDPDVVLLQATPSLRSGPS